MDNIDPRILNLSYSSLGLKHACPRRFQLYRLNAEEQEYGDEDTTATTFAYGHVVGEGIQQVLQEVSEDRIFFNMFVGWHTDLLASNDKQKKSFWSAMFAIQKFIAMRNAGYLKDYELVYWQGKPAVELGFRITFPDGFKFRGFVDAVLRHRITGEVVVLECKTSSATNLNPAQYKNSAQAIGYSVVLDILFPELSSYKVIYLVYLTKQMEYEQLDFNKSYLQRALWIQELLLDIEEIKRYEEIGIYPMRGESCYTFYRECEYLQTCTISTVYLTKPYTPPGPDDPVETFDIELTLMDLINSQLAKSESIKAIPAPISPTTSVLPEGATLGDVIL